MRRTAVQHRVDDALVAVCRGEQPFLGEEPGAAEDFVSAARYHRIAPLAHVAVRGSRPDVADALRDDRSQALINHLRTTALLASVAGTLEGIRWLAFKGPILSEFAHPIPGLRFYKDLDLLVGPGEFREACNRLFDAGWQLLLGDDSLESAEFPGEIALGDPHGVVMDLHWSMVVMKSVRSRFQVTADALLDRRVPVTIGPAQLYALAPADALVHVCQHAALIGATKLGHVLDADQLARQVDDWDELVERAAQWGASIQVAAVLGRAQRLLDTPVPAGLDARLGVGPGMRRLLVGVDSQWPIQSLRQDASWVRLVTRALRPGLAGTAATIAGRAANGVAHRLRPAPPRSPRVAASPAVVDAYLARVEAVGAAGYGA
ncbi:nucleotidyltransferase family protein [Tessaracoccus sp. OS52]|uniref:nucleotidyltransferase domain-containing protein n=1 Tax=Tessaracoccus sp. OS52 TaxID=2886691 RepID=UPI001D104E80|nr:nucleotidyltransferase family protein [Tessaracoccus sp. OS52]MCC2593748.1 nucleotidyltransferase family protein [Tessaracoccus sp. OS52]